MNALVYVDTDQGNHEGKSKVAQNEKLHAWVFLYIKYSIKLSENLLILMKSVFVYE